MKKDIAKYFNDEIDSSPPKINYPTNKTIFESIYDTWSWILLDMKDYGIKNIKGYRYILVVIDNFSQLVWTISSWLVEEQIRTITNRGIFSNRSIIET